MCTDEPQQLHLKFDTALMTLASMVSSPPRPIWWCCHASDWSVAIAAPVGPPTSHHAGPAPARNGCTPWWEKPHPREGYRGCVGSPTSDLGTQDFGRVSEGVLTPPCWTAAWKQKQKLSRVWRQGARCATQWHLLLSNTSVAVRPKKFIVWYFGIFLIFETVSENK